MLWYHTVLTLETTVARQQRNQPTQQGKKALRFINLNAIYITLLTRDSLAYLSSPHFCMH